MKVFNCKCKRYSRSCSRQLEVELVGRRVVTTIRHLETDESLTNEWTPAYFFSYVERVLNSNSPVITLLDGFTSRTETITLDVASLQEILNYLGE